MLNCDFFLFLALVGTLYSRKSQVICASTLNGRYTKSIGNYKLTVPHRLSPEGEFQSFSLPQHFSHNPDRRRRKRCVEDPDLIHYGVSIAGQDYHLELWPNHDFISPNIIFEDRDPTAKVQDRKIRSLGDKKLCHYTGKVRGHSKSRAAISTCDGLAGYIVLDNVRYFIEPVAEHQPNEHGHHLHIVHQPRDDMKNYETPRCGTSDNWKEAWKESFRDELMNGRDIRGTRSEHRYLELLMVADKKFIEHHKNSDMELYIMTIMNMVYDFYHDSSSGNMMDIVIMRMMYLQKEEEEIDLEISPTAEKTLESFCNWQAKFNPTDDDPMHHDIAVLLTRYDICSADEGCGLMGLAYVATPCKDDKRCCINEDAGINLGIVVTHEIGHVMGCSHDAQGDSSCEAQDPSDGSYYVMAPFVHMFVTRWSTCSRGFITAMFENGLGECLNDEPPPSNYKFKNVMPGVVYDADAQCGMAYPKSSVCILEQEEFCEMLLCKVNGDQCMGNQEPPADGTKCGENKWCFHGKCVEVGARPAAVNGGWGEWGPFSKCSRSCGGGISASTRDCTNPTPANFGKYCVGERKKSKICNTAPCPEGSPSFREVQCTAQNSVPFEGQLHTWTPFPQKDEPCVLYCVNENRVFTSLKSKVEDGTPCKAGTKDMCVDGACRKVGCDNEFDSDAVEDICGVCNGDGTQCKIVEETYRDTGSRDYKKIVTIPAGSRNIRIDELAPSGNTIAIADKTEKKFYLNGDHVEGRDGEKKIGNVEGIYSHPEPGKETLEIKGPLTEDINFFVCFYNPNENVGYKYRYAEPSTDSSYTPHYQWELLEWSDCTARCGGGEQTAKYDCVEDKAGKVSANFCSGIEKPEESLKKCNEAPCKTKWRIGEWSKCHACKNRSGVRMREVVCVREAPKAGAEDILVEDKECAEAKPGSRELCESHMKCKTRSAVEGEEVPKADIPSVFMEDVYKQINRRGPRNEDTELDKLVDQINGSLGNKSCTEKTINSSILKHVGGVIKDKIPPEEIKLIRVPLKKNNMAMNLSDKAFQSMGDTISDKLDTSHAELLTGKKAADLMKELQHRHDNDTAKGGGSTKKPTSIKPGHKDHKKGHGGHKKGKHHR